MGISTTVAVFCHELPHELGTYTCHLSPITTYLSSVSINLHIIKYIMSTLLPVTGDFAVLLHGGMRVKQALFYNIFSSILCLLGMVIGIFVGNVSTASSWVFALTAGIFIYIALVDMVSNLDLYLRR
jgi:zinc transporter 10